MVAISSQNGGFPWQLRVEETSDSVDLWKPSSAPRRTYVFQRDVCLWWSPTVTMFRKHPLPPKDVGKYAFTLVLHRTKFT